MGMFKKSKAKDRTEVEKKKKKKKKKGEKNVRGGKKQKKWKEEEEDLFPEISLHEPSSDNSFPKLPNSFTAP